MMMAGIGALVLISGLILYMVFGQGQDLTEQMDQNTASIKDEIGEVKEMAISPRVVLTLAAFLVSLTALALEGTLLVANREGGSISFFDLATEREIARVPIGSAIPHEVAISPDGRWAVAGEYGPNGSPGPRLIVIDIVNARVMGRIDLGPASRPHDMVFLPDSRRAVATMQDSDMLALVDALALEVLRTYPTGGREGHMVRLSPDGSRAYVTSRGAEGTLSVIYLEEDIEPTVIEAGPGAEGLTVTADGAEVWVLNRQETTISVIDAQSLKVVEEVSSHTFAGRAEALEGGQVAVVNGMGGQIVGGYLRLYDAESRAVSHDLLIPGNQSGTGGYGLLVHGKVVFLTTRSGGSVLVYDLEDEDPDAPFTLATGHEGPDGMAWTPLRLNVFEN